jgi:cupin superfamily acireductone dioxygenase involved in methionine salvage
MAIVTLCDENRTLREMPAIVQHLAAIGIDYEQWNPSHPVEPTSQPRRSSRPTLQRLKNSKRVAAMSPPT